MRWQVRFDRQTLREELLVEVLASLLTHQDASAVLVLQWATRLAHHLQNIHHRVVNIPMFFALIKLDAHDDNHMAGYRQTPSRILSKMISQKNALVNKQQLTLDATKTWIAPDSKSRCTIRLSCLSRASW